MKENQHEIQEIKMVKLTWPLFIQMLLIYIVLLTDSFFLSKISDNCAASIGAIFPIICIAYMLFNQLGQAGCSVASQYIGAKKYEQVTPTYITSIILSTIAGLVVCILFLIFSSSVGTWVGLSQSDNQSTSNYLNIFAISLMLNSMVGAYSGILSSRGKTVYNMFGSILFNGVNVLVNIIFLAGFLGVPKLGVVGVALATLIAQIIYLAFLMIIVHFKEKIGFKLSEIKTKFLTITKNILNIGLPGSIEPISVQLVSLVVTIMIVNFGMVQMAAKTYVYNIATIVIAFSVAMGIATQIVVAHSVGAKNYKRANSQLHKSILVSVAINFLFILIVYLFADPVLRLFTSNQDIINLSKIILLISMFMHPVSSINIIVQNSLVGAGDSKFSSIVGMIAMWVIGIPLYYLFGIHFKFGLIGIWIAMLLDESTRAIIYYIRWRQRKWEKTSVIHKEEEQAQEILPQVDNNY